MAKRRDSFRQIGISMIEGMIGILIVTIVVLGLIPIFVRTFYVQHNAEELVLAANLAREKIEQLKAVGYDGLAIGETTEETEDGNFRLITKITNELDANGNPKRMKKIEVKVYRLRPTESHISTHVTYIHKRGL